MLDVLTLVAPIFGLIALGFVVAKARYVSEGMGKAASVLGYKVAMPALLFRAMLAVGDGPVSPLLLIAAYLAGILMAWCLATLATRLLLRRPAVDAPAIAMGCCFSNGVMLGFPIIIQAFGPEAATPLAFLATCETLFLWTFATLHMALAESGGRTLSLKSLAAVMSDVALNPLIIAMATGLGFRYLGAGLPPLADKLLDLVAQAAVPVSLLGLGMSLAAYQIKGQAPTVGTILAIKMLIYPVLAFIIADRVMALPPLWVGVLATYVSMPVGANAFLFAARYDRAVASISASVAISTGLAVISATLVLYGLKLMGFVRAV